MYLKSFLSQAKLNLQNNNINHIVVGNESADLDSIISAQLLALAYTKKGVDNVIPLININKQDYKLRTESYGLLKRYNIDENDLIFINDIPEELISNPKDIKITVVDHNKLPDNLRNWDNSVVAIFDHHQDVNEYKNANPRIFSTCGSCSTLIAQYILENIPQLFADNKDLAILNISPILVDTINLDPEQKRVTGLDIEISEKLKKYIDIDIQKLYNDLQYMKSDVSALNTTDLLRKDYKQWTSKITYGMSSVPIPIEEWLKKDNNITLSTDKYIDDKGLELLIIMTAFVNNNGFNRELIVTGKNATQVNDICKFLNDKDLQLEPYPVEIQKNNYETKTFVQKNLALSRKKVQPLIEEFLNK